jgi:hypothetical protein
VTQCPLAKPSEFTGGGFFKPADHLTDLALLVEPKRIDRGVQNTYQGRITLRDEVTCDIAIFATSEALDTRTPTATFKDVRVVHAMLTSTLERLIGGALVANVRKIPTKSGSGYAFRDVDDPVQAAVSDYYDHREAQVTAALASGDMPSFDG